MDNDKYVVMKRDDFDHWWMHIIRPSLADPNGNPPPASLNDAVVIRLQDIFASAGLSAYAHVVQTFIEAVRWREDGTGNPTVDLSNLEALRDFFFEQADHARTYPNKKVPD